MNNSQCLMCKHYYGLMKCSAFDDKIPEKIMTGLHDHTKPYPGDNDIRFEPIEKNSNDRTND